MSTTINFIVPTLKPVGGIVKCFDYILHSLSLGYQVSVFCDERPDPTLALFQHPKFGSLLLDRITFSPLADLSVSKTSFYFFSLPSDFRVIEPLLRRGVPKERVIHIIQNTRHASPSFQEGYAIRLLTRPLSRIVINSEVMAAISPYLQMGSYCRMIPLAHDSAYFVREDREDHRPRSPLRVGYMTWKSDFGDRLSSEMTADTRLEFVALRNTVAWPELRRFYHSIDILLCTPNREEGFYLPGLEGMAAGCIVVVPNVQGNMSYCQFNENCLGYDFEDIQSAKRALEFLLDKEPSYVDAMRVEADKTWRERDLSVECKAFEDFLNEL